MNEGKQRLEALRKKLKKKPNNETPLNNLSNGGQSNGNTSVEISNNKIPIEQRIEKSQKLVQKSDKTQKQKVPLNEVKKHEDKMNSSVPNVVKNKQTQQALQQGQIQEEQEKKQEKEEIKPQESEKIKPLEPAKIQKRELSYSIPSQDLIVNPSVKEAQSQQNHDRKDINHARQDQDIKDSLVAQNMEQQEGQVLNNNEQKDLNIQQEKNEKIIEEKREQKNKNSDQIVQNNENQVQQKIGKEVTVQNPIQAEEKSQQIISNIKDQQIAVNKSQQQTINKTPSNDSLQASQSLHIQPSHSHHNNSTHLSQRRNHHHQNHHPSNKPAIKIVLKQLQMIKSSIHNLNVTYRGVQYLRQKIKHDPILKRKIKQRLMDLQGDNQMDVLRKLVKKVQQSCVNSTQSQKLPPIKEIKPHSSILIEPNLINQQSISQKIVSQPQVSISNDAIEY